MSTHKRRALDRKIQARKWVVYRILDEKREAEHLALQAAIAAMEDKWYQAAEQDRAKKKRHWWSR